MAVTLSFGWKLVLAASCPEEAAGVICVIVAGGGWQRLKGLVQFQHLVLFE